MGPGNQENQGGLEDEDPPVTAPPDVGADGVDLEIPDPRTRPYDPSPKRESVRGWIAGSLVALLAVMAFVPLVSVIAGWASWEEFEGPMTLSFGSVVGLVGTVLGFYFGSSRDRGPN